MGKAKDFFEEDLKSIPERNAEETASLFYAAKNGDEKALISFIETMQHHVYRAALLFEPEDDLFMDLVQEGNLALLGLMNEEIEKERLSEVFEETIRDAMHGFLKAEADEKSVAEELKTKLNVIDAITMKIAEEENREASAEEIAELMKISADDVKYLMKIALSALSGEG